MLKKRIKFLLFNCILLFGVAVFFVWAGQVLAQGADMGIDRAANIGLQEAPQDDVRVFIVEAVRYFITFLGIIAVAIIMYAGFLWMTSGGDPEKINRAKSALINASIGLIIIISAFAIVSFIINLMDGGGGGAGSGNNEPNYGLGLGAYGNCAIEATYPEPFQKDVPRNSMISVSFVEEIDAGSVISGGKIIDDGRIKIYRKGDEANYLKDVGASVSAGDKTFVFSPAELLGSPSENTEYYVYLSNDIKKKDGKPVFDNCLEKFALWSFEVSTKIDLTPPQIKDAGVFPAPDKHQDSLSAVTAEKAEGEVSFLGMPLERKQAEFNLTGGGKSAVLDSENAYSSQNGNLTLAILSDGTTAKLENTSLGASLGTAVASGKQIVFPGLFTFVLDDSEEFAAGDSWKINARAYASGDLLVIGAETYFFGAGGISLGASPALCAQNAAAKINSHPEVSASAAGNIVTITARNAGTAGNGIVLSSSNGAVISISKIMSGGSAAGESAVVSGRMDRPRNSVIQINFNEAINPIGISGKARDIKDNIRVEDMSGAPGNFLEGRFVLSNQYKTLEFISDTLCGVNGCGEKIYCLPAESHLRVLVKAAALAQCPGEINCASKAPYVNCTGGVCQDGDGNNYPMAGINLKGAADMAFNSFDGDRNGLTEGPEAQSGTPAYDENNIIGLCSGGANDGSVCTDANRESVCGASIFCAGAVSVSGEQASGGDDYEWSFYIGRTIKMGAPKIVSIAPNHNAGNISAIDPIIIRFSDLMLISSLSTGEAKIANGNNVIVHKKINLRSLNNRVVGYWTESENLDDPIDGEADWTRVEIGHPQFPQFVSYRPQVGSGVKDVYQNCFKPSEGPLCDGEASDASPSCCPEGADINAVGESALDGKGNCK